PTRRSSDLQWRLCEAVGRATKNRRPVAGRRFLVRLNGSETEYPEHQVVGHDADDGHAGDIQLEAGGDHVADLHVAGTEHDGVRRSGHRHHEGAAGGYRRGYGVEDRRYVLTDR